MNHFKESNADMNFLHNKNIKNKIYSMTRARRADRTENGAAVISNAGFSLIEIIVVVLIIAIAAGAAIMSLSAALRANTTRAATELSSVISEARIEAMSRPVGSVELRVYQSSSDGRFYADIVMKKTGKANAAGTSSSGPEKIIESKSVASGAVSLSASDSSAAAGRSAEIKGSSSAVIKFDKSSGRLSSFKVGTGSGYDSVVISGAKTSTVRIAKMTSRSYVE